ncbi:MAG TPA: guanylate kinase [Gemmatimonadaceae bacterium]|nr:guanylate kinase [Gemmatimonadaceae bacterium]
MSGFFPIILSSPSGGGKTTIAKALLRRRNDLGYSVSCTTRQARPDEKEGQDYFFVSREVFEKGRANGDFAESAEVHGNYYGTLRREVERVLESGRHVIMDIDVQGTRQFVQAYSDAVTVFLIPPDAEILLSRLRGRGTESPETLARRLKSAVEELRAVDLYSYLVVNHDLDEAVRDVSSIIDAESMRYVRLGEIHSRIGAMITDLESELAKMNRRV